MLSQMSEVQKLDPQDVRVLGRRVQDGLESQLLIIQTPFGYRRVAEQFRPEADFAGGARDVERVGRPRADPELMPDLRRLAAELVERSHEGERAQTRVASMVVGYRVHGGVLR